MKSRRMLAALVCMGAVFAVAGVTVTSSREAARGVIGCPSWGCGSNGAKVTGVKGAQPARVRSVTLVTEERVSSR